MKQSYIAIIFGALVVAGAALLWTRPEVGGPYGESVVRNLPG
jgi:hypothetical protein